MSTNKAKFKINASLAVDRGYEAISAQVLTLTLEDATDVQHVRYELYDVNDGNSPLASLSAPDLTFAGGVHTKTLSPADGSTTITMVTNGAETHSWMIRATAVTDTGEHVYERILALKNGKPRKTVPAESEQWGVRGWSDAWNELVDYVTGVIAGSGYTTIQDEGASLTQRTTMNFVGAGVVVTDFGGVTTVTISGGSSAPTGTAVGQVQKWNGTGWIAGAVDLADPDAVTGLLPLANLPNGSATSVLGRAANSSGVVASIAAILDGQVLQRVAGALSWASLPVISTFRGVYYIDPSSTVTATGSESAPYTSFALAKAAVLAAGLTAAVFRLAPGATLTESLTMPSGGGFWEIEGVSRGMGERSIIDGSVVCTSAIQSAFTFTNVHITGAISGDATASTGNFLALRSSAVVGAVTLTHTGSGAWFANLMGEGTNFFAFGGSVGGNFSNPFGQTFAQNWYFGGDVDTGSGPSFIDNSKFGKGSPATLTLASLGATLTNCTFARAFIVTAAASTQLNYDGATGEEMLRLGCTVSANVTLHCLNSNQVVSRAVTANILPAPFNGATTALSLAGLYEASFVLDTTVAATTATPTVNIIYMDRGGTLRTEPVVFDDISTVSKRRGSALFWHNGSTSIAYSVTGFSTPGPLAAWLDGSINMKS